MKKIDLDKIEAYARRGNGDPFLLSLVKDVRLETWADARETLARQLEMMHLTGEADQLSDASVSDHDALVRENQRLSARVQQLVGDLDTDAIVRARLHRDNGDLAARVLELTSQLDAARECNREFFDNIQALTTRAKSAEQALEQNAATCEHGFDVNDGLSERILSLTSQLDAARRTQLGPVSSEVDDLRRRNAELESDLARATASLNDAMGRLHEMTNVAAQTTRDLARSLEAAK